MRDYIKLHAIVGTNTNVIAAARVTDRNGSDTLQLPTLLTTTSYHWMFTL